MRKSIQTKGRAALAGWLLLAILCAAAFWLGQALFNFHTVQEVAAAIPNDLFAEAAARPAAAQPGGGQSLQPTAPPRTVCLTFDDGPSPNTEKILAVLEEHGVPATFFVTAQGVNEEYLPQTAQIVAQGHQLALHSASHDYKKIYASTTAFWLDIKELRQALAPYVAVEDIRWLRFPGGSTNTVSHRYGGRGIMKKLIAEAEEKGYHWIDWNVSAEDATTKHPDAAQILENIQHDARDRDTCVVLMHDTKATGQTVKALPDIIEWFQGEGYTFCTVEQMEARRSA